MDPYSPRAWDLPDAALLLWHRDPASRRFKSMATATRACRWLNANVHNADHWLFEPATFPEGVFLVRRFVGGDPQDWVERPILRRHTPGAGL